MAARVTLAAFFVLAAYALGATADEPTAAVTALQPAPASLTPLNQRIPLHQRIDALVEAAAIGPLAPRSSDADFVRRIYLDLTGVIPTADEARAFVADSAPDKRQRLIDQLLASPAFLRHMTVALDVLLMERKPDKVIKQPEWEKYLYESLAADKPLDRLFQEILTADGGDASSRPAARFTLDRDAEPNLLTRDIGRLAFGMDLQCCQCHDHPLIDDYYQDDYYGLFAFVSRTSLFTDAKTKAVSLGEKADGEASFKSVFTGASSDRAQPRLPKGPLLFREPVFAPGEEYQVKPDKTVRGVPRFSRRAALAQLLPKSREFAVNLANRLWAHMFGRGLVHPLDFHHAANPPSNPALLSLLADALSAAPLSKAHAPLPRYRLRPFLRELALSRAYQRTCDEPSSEVINYVDVAARLTSLTAELNAHQQSLGPLESALADALTAFKRQRDEETRLAAEIPKLEAQLAAARNDSQRLAAVRQAREKAAETSASQLAAVQAAAARLAELAAILKDAGAVRHSAAELQNQAEQLNSALQTVAAASAEPTPEETAALERIAQADEALAAARRARPALESLIELEQTYLSARHRLAEAKTSVKAIENRRALAGDILAYPALAASGSPKAAPHWSSLVERWTIAHQIAPLRPLTPEQFAASAMQATGHFPAAKTPDRAVSSAKEPTNEPAKKADASASDHSELALLEKLRPTVREFVRYYGGQPGEEFQATVNQALFFGNGAQLDSWLKPAGENLVARLTSCRADDVADDLYWSVFSRPPTDAERLAVAGHLQDRPDRPAALAEITWALLSSTEFRFNH